MNSKGNAPNARQRQWREKVRAIGSIISGDDAVIHHCIGVTGKHNKVHIGHWWIIPLTDEEHKALHAGETFGHESRKEFEKQAFIDVCQIIYPVEYITPAIEAAIEDYHL